MRKRNSGTTLLELLIAITVLSIVALIVVPSLLDALQKGKQKRTLADMKMAGTAMMAWLTDEMSAAAAGSQVDLGSSQEVSHGELASLLVPTYVQQIPGVDGWGNSFDYFLENNLSGAVGGEDVTLAIRSRGRDGVAEGNGYAWGTFHPADYDRDIVWKDGFFVRWPGLGTDEDEGDDAEGDGDSGDEGDSDSGDEGNGGGPGCDQGLGNGSEGCDPGNSNQGDPSNSNDENGGSPGNPGKKGGPGGGPGGGGPPGGGDD